MDFADTAIPPQRDELHTQRAGRNGHVSVSVIIPTYNEAANLPHVFAALADDWEIIVVDGRSHDGTIEVARALRPDVKIVLQTRKGKGNALACGFAAATGDVLVMLDADGSADPGEVEAFVAALTSGADFAKGTRFAKGGGSSDITPVRRLGNKALNGLVNVLYGTRYTDLCYGYNAFWRRCLPVIDVHPGARGDDMLWGDGFEIETIINVRIASAGLKIAEVASFEHDRIHGASNLNAVTDGLRVLKAILVERRLAKTRSAAMVPAPVELEVLDSVEPDLELGRANVIDLVDLADLAGPVTVVDLVDPVGQRRARRAQRDGDEFPEQSYAV